MGNVAGCEENQEHFWLGKHQSLKARYRIEALGCGCKPGLRASWWIDFRKRFGKTRLKGKPCLLAYETDGFRAKDTLWELTLPLALGFREK